MISLHSTRPSVSFSLEQLIIVHEVISDIQEEYNLGVEFTDSAIPMVDDLYPYCKGRNLKSVGFAVSYLVAREVKSPIIFSDLIEDFDLDRKELMNLIKQLRHFKRWWRR